MKNVVFDCDNTMGVVDCDVDDGLALLYLLGTNKVNLLGITTTYGNSDIDIVYPNTVNILKEIGYSNIPVFKGGSKAGEYKNNASQFLVGIAQEYKDHLSILATGSLTNIYGAYLIDNNFFDNVSEIILMGGITEPLIFEKREMDELNFSCDPDASYNVLINSRNLSIITGNNCLKALFTKNEFKANLLSGKNSASNYIYNKSDYWFEYNERVYGIEGFYNWDVLAAVYLVNSELFIDKSRPFLLNKSDLSKGFLREDDTGININLSEVIDEKIIKKNIYDNWRNVSLK